MKAHMRPGAQWRYAKSRHVLFFDAARCTSLHDGALSVVELTRWRSGVRVPHESATCFVVFFRVSDVNRVSIAFAGCSQM